MYLVSGEWSVLANSRSSRYFVTVVYWTDTPRGVRPTDRDEITVTVNDVRVRMNAMFYSCCVRLVVGFCGDHPQHCN